MNDKYEVRIAGPHERIIAPERDDKQEGPSKVCPPSNVEAQMKYLGGQLERLQAISEKLRVKLQPILCNEEVENSSVSEARKAMPESASLLARALESQVSLADRIGTHLSALLQQIEL